LKNLQTILIKIDFFRKQFHFKFFTSLCRYGVAIDIYIGTFFNFKDCH
jgi:hypothetical protein